MSKRTSSSKEVPAATTSSRRSVQRTAVSKITGRETGPSLIPTAGGRPRLSASSIYRRSAEKDTVQALMDLSLPRFTKLDDGVIPKTKPWPVAENSPASPASAEDGNRTRMPSPCMDLDEISSDSLVGDASPHDFKVTLLYDLDHSQDMPAEGSIFDVSPDIPGFSMRPAGGGVQPTEITKPPAVKLRQFQQPVLRSTNCVCSMPQYPGNGYTDDCANI